MKPLVSVIIPVYNGSNFLSKAIDSALAQTYPNIEIIVVNDGSNDNGKTEKVALSYGNRIRYFSKPNGGVSSALNEGINKMEGKYFSWLSHDDVYAPDKILRQIETLKNRDKNTVCFCTSRQINADSDFISEPRNMDLNNGCILKSRDALYYTMSHTLNGCSMLIPKTAFDECGGFDEEMRYCQDVFMWWQILIRGYSLAFCDYTGVYSRVHGAQLTDSTSELYHRDALRIAKDIVPSFAELSDKNINILYAFAVGEAVHANKQSLKFIFDEEKGKGLFSPSQKLHLRFLLFYGRVLRPAIRKVYYQLKRTSR